MYNNITKIMCFDRFIDVFSLILCVKTLIFQKKINNNVFNFIVNDEKMCKPFPIINYCVDSDGRWWHGMCLSGFGW